MIPTDELAATRTQVVRQVAHWNSAAQRLQDLNDFASPGAWAELEVYLGIALRKSLSSTTQRLMQQAEILRATLIASQARGDYVQTQRHLVAFRRQYLRTETTLSFYANAINSRNSPKMAALLRACDSLAHRSMTQLLNPLNQPTPIVLTYIDQGLGASILKAGLRLWDGGTMSPAAAIKIVRHNLLRPTSLIHEAGHQVAHIVGWNEELAQALHHGLAGGSGRLAELWASWATEIAADAFAFVHTGYAAVASLHDVLAGGERFVFRFVPGDPHPISYVRVLLGVEMCRQAYGDGPWDGLAQSWIEQNALESANPRVRSVVEASMALLPAAARIIMNQRMRAFGGRPLVGIISPQRVSPTALRRMEDQLGPALYTSMHWIWTESLRLLALTGLKIAVQPERATETLAQQQEWMLRLGQALKTRTWKGTTHHDIRQD